MHDLIIKFLSEILIGLVSIGTVVLITFLRRKGWLDKIETELLIKQELATLAVRFAEQFYRDLGGPEKYVQASVWLSARLSEKGIAISEEEIRGLIEAALREIKDQFGNEWAKIIAPAS